MAELAVVVDLMTNNIYKIELATGRDCSLNVPAD